MIHEPWKTFARWLLALARMRFNWDQIHRSQRLRFCFCTCKTSGSIRIGYREFDPSQFPRNRLSPSREYLYCNAPGCRFPRSPATKSSMNNHLVRHGPSQHTNATGHSERKRLHIRRSTYGAREGITMRLVGLQSSRGLWLQR